MNLDTLLSQEESESLSFKAAFPTDTTLLLHNILCMANAYADSDRYLVFGVNSADKSIYGVEADLNIKDAVAIQTLLRHACLNRIPSVKLATYEYLGHTVVVLTIANRPDKPFYVTEDHSDMDNVLRAGVIYTRVGTVNTPLSGTASDQDIEIMWRERFGLGLPPLARLSHLLDQTEAWICSPDKLQFYHKDFPEFTLAEGETVLHGYSESWSERFFDPYARSYNIEVRYFGSVLQKYLFVSCDGSRYQIPAPKRERDHSWTLDPHSPEYKIAKLMQSVSLLEAGLKHAKINLIIEQPMQMLKQAV
jgi:hypothetical protein